MHIVSDQQFPSGILVSTFSKAALVDAPLVVFQQGVYEPEKDSRSFHVVRFLFPCLPCARLTFRRLQVLARKQENPFCKIVTSFQLVVQAANRVEAKNSRSRYGCEGIRQRELPKPDPSRVTGLQFLFSTSSLAPVCIPRSVVDFVPLCFDLVTGNRKLRRSEGIVNSRNDYFFEAIKSFPSENR